MKRTPFTVFITAVPVSVAAFLTSGCTGHPISHGGGTGDGEPGTFVGRVYDESGNLREPAPLPKVVRTEDDWQARLTPDRYRILRQHGTERAFTGDLLANTATGVYRCAACDLPLYASDTKFKSGTGWPSFYAPIADGNVGERSDGSIGMMRTEIHCARCEGHLGHVFPDGPPPTGQRHCVNALSIAFTPIEQIATLAEPVPENPAAGSTAMASTGDTASLFLAGGCFWCVEAVFEELNGVVEAVSGYAGGTPETANYEAVCSGRTGHAEAVQIIYDPARITYEQLLRVHFATHDPTTLNRQGADVGPQYRSAIFFANDQEKATVRSFIAGLTAEKAFAGRPIVTTLEPLTEFYPAEEYHQNYVARNPSNRYVQYTSLPKVKKVRKEFAVILKDESPIAWLGRN